MRFIVVLISACALSACGLATGVRGWYVASFALFFVLFYALLSSLSGLLGLSVSVKRGKRRAARGEGSSLTVRVIQKSPFPLGEARLFIKSGDFEGEREISFCPTPFASREIAYPLANAHRGVYTTGVVRLAVRDVFGLVRFTKRVGGNTYTSEILPRVTEHAPMALSAYALSGASSNIATDDASSPAGVREWKEGDPLKRIHWKLSVRERELYVREFEESAKPDALIIPDVRYFGGFGARRRDIEDEVCEQALANVIACEEAGFDSRLLLFGERPVEAAAGGAGGIENIREILMRAEFTGAADYSEALASAMGRLLRTGACVIITPEISGRIVELAAGIARMNVATRVVCVTKAQTAQALDMLKRLNASGVEVC